MRLPALGRRYTDLDSWLQIRFPHRLLVGISIFGILFVAGEVLTLGKLVVAPPETVTLYWFNLYFDSATETSGGTLMALGFCWVIVSGIAYIVLRRLEILVISGFLVQSLFSAKLSPLVLIDVYGTSLTASSLYWLMSGALVMIFRPSGFVSPFRIDDRAWHAVLAILGVATIGLIWGLARGNSGFFQYANYLEFVSAVFLTYLMVRADGPFRHFLPVVLIAGTARALWGYGLLATNSGLSDTGGWGALGVSTPALSVLVFPLLIGVLIVAYMGMYGSVRIRSQKLVVAVSLVLPWLTILPVVFSIQRSHWAALFVGISSLLALILVVPSRLIAAGVVVAVVGAAVVAAPVYVPILNSATSNDDVASVAATAIPMPESEVSAEESEFPAVVPKTDDAPGAEATALVEPTVVPEPSVFPAVVPKTDDAPGAEATALVEPTVVPEPSVSAEPRGSIFTAIRKRIDHTVTEFKPGSGYSRAQDIENAISALKRNPLLGDGLGVHYYYTFDPRGDRPYTEGELNPSFHMSIVWVLATTGLLGLLAILAAVFIPAARAARLGFSGSMSTYDRVLLICAGSTLLVALTYISIDQWLPHSSRTPVLGVVVGGVVGLIRWYESHND